MAINKWPAPFVEQGGPVWFSRNVPGQGRQIKMKSSTPISLSEAP